MSDFHKISVKTKVGRVGEVKSKSTHSHFEVKSGLPAGGRFSAAGLAGGGMIIGIIAAIFRFFSSLMSGFGSLVQGGPLKFLDDWGKKVSELFQGKKDQAPPPPKIEHRVAAIENAIGMNATTGIASNPIKKLGH